MQQRLDVKLTYRKGKVKAAVCLIALLSRAPLAGGGQVHLTAGLIDCATAYRAAADEYHAGHFDRNVFLKIVSEFKTRYVLTYLPANVPPAGWHPSPCGSRMARRTFARAAGTRDSRRLPARS